jgi:acetyltransferase-like isoleucine patch superfamily enzyme
MISRLKLTVKNRLYLVNKSISNFYFVTLLKKPHYLYIDNSQLLLNWIVQRLFKMNSDMPFSVSYTTRIQGFKNIKLAENANSIKTSFAVSGGCYFTIFDSTTLEIGENTLWAHNVCIQTGNHDVIDRTKHKLASVKIGKNCWIGNSVTILPGVELGDNVTVGANSVVTKSFPSNCVIGGCPAKIIKQFN